VHNLSNATELAGTASFTTGTPPDIVKIFGMGNAFIIGNPHTKSRTMIKTNIIDMSSNTVKVCNICKGDIYYDTDTNGYTTENIYSGKLMSVSLFSNNSDQYERMTLINPMYLTTINNLETPVVKTSDKTMKITYTITQTE
jgi:hypothetical protein